MIRKKNDQGEWLEFSLLQNFPNVVHGVLLKECLEADFLDHSGIPSSISSHQVHGSVVKDIEDLVLDPKSDGLFTRQSNIALSIRHADCQAAIFYDPIQNAIANIHCGWRGNVQNIYGKAIQTMKDTLGSKAEDLIVCISPSLGPDHAEFLNFEDEFPFDFWPFQVRPCYFDLWQISRNQLEEAGVRSKNIEIAQICTYDNPSDFYSYRLDKTAHRNHTLVALR
jgi:YfiH family protein